MSSHYFLNPGDSVTVDGVEFSYDDIMNSKIDSVLYRKHLKELQEKANPGIKIILVGNKSDLINKRVVNSEDVEKMINDYDIDLHIETSAKNGNNVKELFVEASKMLYKEYLSLKKNNTKRKESSNKIILEESEKNEFESKDNCIC